MLTIDVTVIGFEPLKQYHKVMLRRLSRGNRRRHLRRVGRYMRRSIRKNFMVGGREGGVPGVWPKLTYRNRHKYVTRKGNKRTENRPLVGTKAMMNSVRWWLYGIEEYVKIGTRSPIARFHQFGMGHNPLRRFVMYQPEDVRRVRQMAVDDIMGASKYGTHTLKGTGFRWTGVDKWK